VTNRNRVKTRATALVLLFVFLCGTIGSGLFVQGLVIMRSEVVADPLTWSPNMVGAIVMLGIAVPALGGFLMWWNAPAGAKSVEPTELVQSLFRFGKLLSWLAFAFLILSLVGSAG